MKKSFFLVNDSEKKEQVLELLTRISLRRIPNDIWLLIEPWDWLVIMQWLQDKGFIQTNPVRPPFKAFERWLRENNVPERKVPYSAYQMSLAHRFIGGARYPWKQVTAEGYVGMIGRWRMLYEDLSRMMTE